MNERMRKRLVSRESPDTRVLREAMRIASEHLDYLDYLLDHRRWLAGPGPQPRRLHRRRAFERDRLSRRARLARAQADQGLVRGDEVAALFPPAAGRADGGDRAAGALRQGRLLAGPRPRSALREGSRSSSVCPAPSATQLIGSSATRTGRPVESCSTVANSRSSEPPPVMVMPWSITSAAISGWVCSSAVRTTSTIWLTGSLSASATCAWSSSISRGHSAPDVAAANAGNRPAPVARPNRRADFELHPFRGALADQQIVVAPDVGGDGVVHAVAAHARGSAEGEAAATKSRRPRSCRRRYRRPSIRSGRRPAGRRRSPRPSVPRSARRGRRRRWSLRRGSRGARPRSRPTARRSRPRARARSGSARHAPCG